MISDQDFTHRVAFSAIYELPFGKNRSWMARAGGMAGALVGGWQVQGIYAGQSGQALGFGNGIFNGNLHDIVIPKGSRKVERWFNMDVGFERDSKKQLASNFRTFPARFSGVRGAGPSVVLILALVLSGPCSAQEARGTILGPVTDSSGAVVPGAAVRIVNAATGLTVSAESNERGNYHAPFLIPGSYRMTSEVKGFKRFERANLDLRVSDRLEVNIMLERGEVTETVTVTAESPLLDTATASTGQVVDARRVAELPIPHGNPFHLAQLAPGVTYAGTITHDRPYDSYAHAVAVDGTRALRSEITVDGVPTSSTNMGPGQLINSYTPPADMVAEFKVQTATFDASVGNTEGGAINVSLKSGTNDFHGTALYVKMTPEPTANLFFANRPAQRRPDFAYDRWGTTANGPVILPRLYNGRNRTFFFYGYEGIPESQPRGSTLTVRTEKHRAGDFSHLLRLGTRYQIYHPNTRRAIPGGRFHSDRLPGNMIPPARINLIAPKILGYSSLPTASGTTDGMNNLPLPNEPENLTYYVHTWRVDHNPSPRHRLYIRANVYKRVSDLNKWFHNFTTGEYFQYLSRGAAFDDVYSVSPTLVMNFRYGYDRFGRTYDAPPGSRGFDLTTQGPPKAHNDAVPESIRRLPYITISGYASTYNGTLRRPDDKHAGRKSGFQVHFRAGRARLPVD